MWWDLLIGKSVLECNLTAQSTLIWEQNQFVGEQKEFLAIMAGVPANGEEQGSGRGCCYQQCPGDGADAQCLVP